MLRFAWADAKAALGAAIRAFAWTTGGVGLALFAAVLLNPSRSEPLTTASVTATLIVALFYAMLPGIVAATGVAMFRLAGAWAFLPVVVFPLVVLGVFWLGGGVLAGQEDHIWSAFGAELKGNVSVLGGIKVHSIQELMLVLLLYGLYSALQPPVLWQLFQYLLLVVTLVGIALLLTCVITLPPLLFSIARRTRLRYADHMAHRRA